MRTKLSDAGSGLLEAIDDWRDRPSIALLSIVAGARGHFVAGVDRSTSTSLSRTLALENPRCEDFLGGSLDVEVPVVNKE